MLAITNRTITFVDFDNETIIINPETVLFIDIENGIACYQSHQFDIKTYEYSTIC